MVICIWGMLLGLGFVVSICVGIGYIGRLAGLLFLFAITSVYKVWLWVYSCFVVCLFGLLMFVFAFSFVVVGFCFVVFCALLFDLWFQWDRWV
jgi:hypothetical protein